MAECKRCRERGKTWQGGDPVCGFDEAGNFLDSNFLCATLGALRDFAADSTTATWHEDSWMAILCGPEQCQMLDKDTYPNAGRGPAYVVMRWYKHRGRTEDVLWWSSSESPRPITLVEAELVISELEVRHG